MKFSSFSGYNSVTVQPGSLCSLLYVTIVERMLRIQSIKNGKQHIAYDSHEIIDEGPPTNVLTKIHMMTEIMNYTKNGQNSQLLFLSRQ